MGWEAVRETAGEGLVILVLGVDEVLTDEVDAPLWHAPENDESINARNIKCRRGLLWK